MEMGSPDARTPPCDRKANKFTGGLVLDSRKTVKTIWFETDIGLASARGFFQNAAAKG